MQLLVAALTLLLEAVTAAHPVHHQQACTQSEHRRAAQEPSEFEANVRPILDQHCKPCHFAGGRMYDKLPFDRPETILKLGEKLFTRIKNEDDRAVIRRFLASRK